MSQEKQIWIITRFRTKCAECDEELPHGSRILWLPDAPRDHNNYCAPCGTDIAGSYPPAHYWELRQQRFDEA